MDGFRAGSAWVLIATDLLGRGMDFLGVTTVLNYDFPASTHDYVHRVGRTGRAGLPGGPPGPENENTNMHAAKRLSQSLWASP